VSGGGDAFLAGRASRPAQTLHPHDSKEFSLLARPLLQWKDRLLGALIN